MAVLPGESDYSGIPSPRSGRVVARYDVTPVQEGVAALGAGLANFGKGITQLAERVAIKRIEQQAYDVETAYQQFQFEEAKAFNDAVRNIQPGQAAGFADTWTAGYRTRANAFANGYLTRQPDAVRRDYDQKLFGREREFYSNSLQFEEAEQERHSLIQLENTINNTVLPQVVAARDASNPQQALETAIRLGNQMIDQNPWTTAIQKEEQRTAWRERAQRAYVEGLPVEDVPRWLGTEPVSNADRIIEIESSGRTNAQPIDPATGEPLSSAYGPGQFIEGTWLGLLVKYRPDVISSHSNPDGTPNREALLALRTDPELSREMTVHYTEENTQYLSDNGLAPTPGSVYLAHFLGPGGAVTLLRSGREVAVEDILPANVISANRSVLEGKTVGEIIAWADEKMGSARTPQTPAILDAIPFEDRQALTADANAAMVRQRNEALAGQQAVYDQQYNDLLIGIHDGRYGLATIEDARRSWLTDYNDIARAEQVFEQYNAGQLKTAEAIAQFQNGDYWFNPNSEQDQDRTDLVFDAMGGLGALVNDDPDDPDAQAEAIARLRTVFTRTGIVPTEALDALTGGMYAADVNIRTSALTLLDGLYRENPTAVNQALTDTQLERLQTFQTLSPFMTPEQMTEILDPSQDPRDVERRQVLAREGRELAAEVDVGVILNAFDPGIFAGQPLAPAEPSVMTSLRNDFEDLYGHYYSLTGRQDLAQQMALRNLQTKWGITNTGPDRRLVPYPPENFYQPVDGSYAWMRQDLETFIEEIYPDARYYEVVASRQTEAHLDTGHPPYDIFIIDAQGVARTVQNFEFEFERYRQESLDRFAIDRQNALREDNFFQELPRLPAGQVLPGYLTPETMTDADRAALNTDLDARQAEIDAVRQRAQNQQQRLQLILRREDARIRLLGTIP